MLLRRMIQHVGDQNWFAVVLDFVIVVAGVLLAFQITAWSAERQARADERSALILLQAEAEHVVVYWQRAVRESTERDANRVALLVALQAGSFATEDRGVIDDAIQRMYHYPSAFPPRNAHDALMASGGLASISDIEARNAVSAYATWMEFIDGQLDQFRLSTPLQADMRAGRIISVYDPDNRSLRRFEYDFPALAQDEVFVSGMVEGARNQRVFQRYRITALQHAVRMCQSVSAALALTCDGITEANAALAEAQEPIQ